MVNQKTDEWRVSGKENAHLDPLLDALTFLSKWYGNPVARDDLAAGLPLQDNRFTPELFMRAASRASLSARMLKRSLADIKPELLPAVLLMRDKSAVILQSVDQQRARIIVLESGEGETTIDLDELGNSYEGYALFVKPQVRFDERAPETLENKDEHWFWGTLKRSWRIYRDVLVASFLISLFALASPLFVMNVYDRVVPNNAVDTLWVLAIGVLLVFVFDFILRQLRSHFIDVAGKKSEILISASILERVLGVKMASRPPSVGAFARHLQEFDSIREFITSATITAVIDVPFTLVFFIIVAMLGGWIVAIPLAMVAIIIAYSAWAQGPMSRAVDEAGRMSSLKNATLIEALNGLETIKLTGAEGQMQQRWEQANGHIAEWNANSRRYATSVSSVASLCLQATTVFLIVAGVYLINIGELSMGGLIASVMLSTRALQPMAQVAQLATRYNQTKSAFVMLNDIMKLPVELPEEKRFLYREKLLGNIDLKDVNFHYPDQQNMALNDINLSIKAGEKVAIIGRIGSGKSTLGKLITAMYEATRGSISFDNVDGRQLSPSHIRHMMGVVPQDVTLFYGTLRDNLTLGVPWVSDDAVLRAAELSGVAEFAARHPQGLDMSIAEQGSNLSGGQRQAVALARALLLDPPVLVFDEPTASMDNTSEVRLRNRLADIVPDKTLLLITHKSSMLSMVDRLIVVEQGRIIADGPKAVVQDALRSGRLQVDKT
ncbi:type I secretion system permease/ATPase [Echinimonas agarilytica]|uniref:Type I secretion system permease/ATPase n=1 Tax=Echinimonas agarilytica TaxID=1215918 RepID=A0AA42B7X8_9GAMM|nr:type I secretion system permease/ATPase [Echinimonas agarilytica]MCM2680332.1 type I secretion system permease/ATPase [Echinimonas agarilytica]